MNTLPARSSRMKAVVASAGSRRSARAAIARVAAAASTAVTPPSSGTNTCTPLAPLVLTAPARPTSASAWRTRCAARTARPNASADGGSMSSMRWVGWSHSPARTRPGWYSTARWLREPQQRPVVVAQCVGNLALGRFGPHRDRLHPRRGVLGHVLLHERRLAPQRPDHGQRPIGQHRQDLVAAPRPGSPPDPAWWPPPRRRAAGQGWSAGPRPVRRPRSSAQLGIDSPPRPARTADGAGRDRPCLGSVISATGCEGNLP